MDQPTKKKSFLRRLARIVIKTLLFITVFLLLVILLIQTGPVQNYLRKKTIAYLEKKLQTRVEIGRLYVGLPKNIILENIYVEDRQKDTLLSGGKIKVNLNLINLAFKNEINFKSISLENITAKVKRQLPDTTYNFQFIVDAFTSKDTVAGTDSSVVNIGLSTIEMNKIRLIYQDVISGSDMEAWLEHLDTKVEKFDMENMHFDVPLTNISGLTARIYQVKPLARPEPEMKDMVEATQPFPLKLDFKEVDLKNIKIDFRNDVSAFYSTVNLGALNVKPKLIDLDNRVIIVDDVFLENTITAIRLGRKEEARVVVKEVEQEAKSQVEAGWRIQVGSIKLNNNDFKFDNDNSPRLSYGMDYAHLHADSVTLDVDNLVLSSDSIAGIVNKASFTEQSGFVLQQLQTSFLYSNTQAYLKDFLLKTPGTELKRYAQLDYYSRDALAKDFGRTKIEADINNSYIQVKDILAFAPQLRFQPAFSNPQAIWYLNLQGDGNFASMRIDDLQFRGLKNTQVNASGTLSLNSKSNQAGGKLTIRRLHTTQSDIALFTGTRLTNAQVNLPEEFDATGTLSGSIDNLATNLNISTSMGAATVNGRFTNLTNPAITGYNGQVRTNSLQLGRILRNDQLGRISANLSVSGKGFTPGQMNTAFKGTVSSVAFNNYTYRNITVDGKLNGDKYTVTADVRDPNVDLDGTLTGNMSVNPSFQFDGFIDSAKLMPLGFATQPLVVRGKIVADVPVINADNIEADVLLTEALFVSSAQRLPLDTVHFVAGGAGSSRFMRLNSDVANASINGQYRYTDLGKIFQNSLQPYFSVAPRSELAGVQPYDFTFTADISDAPVLSALVPGLKSFEPIHIEGAANTANGLSAKVNSNFISYNGNEINGLDLTVNTTAQGLAFNADIQRMKGMGLDLYRTKLRGTALNNVIDFNLDIHDNRDRSKYYLSGIFKQPSTGTYTLNLRPDSLLLNYENWTVSPGNSITITKDNIIADNFTLQRNDQKIALQSVGQQLNVGFTNFQLSTVTAFMNSDSLLVNGSLNGTMTLKNVLKQPVFTSDLAITDLSFKGDTVGNAVIKVDNIGNRYNTQANITGRGNDISLTGSFAPKGEKDIALDLNLSIKQMQLATMEGAFAGMIKNASGSVNGDIKIAGSLSEPKINGPLNFNKASFAISILGSQFRIDGAKIDVTQNGFNFDNFVIRDTANNELVLNGIVQTPNFVNYFFDLDVRTTKFKVLQTTKKDSKLYYGDLVITSNLHIDGTEVKPFVDGNITVDDGTNLSVVIPQREPGVVQREGIVEFIDMGTPANDTLFRDYDSLNYTPFMGAEITTNIEIKKEAIFNVVIDEANGDFLNVQGEAQLSTGIDPTGKITLVGTYELEQGAYEISFNFLRRRFDIKKGSKIVWLNEPTKATMDVTAVYVANTSPIDLVENQIEAATTAIRNTYLQKLPFEVRLTMTGELLQPTVTFDIVLPSDKNYGVSNDIITQVDSRLAQLREEPGEINKQVFALLLLNRFVGQNPLASSTPFFSASTYARQSVSKLLTEQLSKLAAGLIDGVDLTFDVTSTDDYTTGDRRSRTDLNVGISKRLLNERLTVSVGSNFELEGPKNSNQKSSNVIGNLSVNYQLTKDGRYMIRFYRKNDYQGVVDGYIVESGLSFIITVDYENFRQLFTRKRRQRVEGVEPPVVK
ncbi:MAG: translocation/assembly module TamB [Chitinophagaceae bacterium]|nr:translocation/assembly module TamB [Chitinophagaceae bacterium]